LIGTLYVELLKGAELNVDVKTPDFIIESGCIFNGKCTMSQTGFETKGPPSFSQEQQNKK